MYRYDNSEGFPNRVGVRTHVSGISIYAFTDRYDDFFLFHMFLIYKPVLNLAVFSYFFGTK